MKNAGKSGQLLPDFGIQWAFYPFVLAMLVLGGLSQPGTAAPPPHPQRLRQESNVAFERYRQLTDLRNEEELRKGTPYLWIDALPEAERAQAVTELRGGAVKMRRVETRDSGRAIASPGAMIHHWEGIVFIPGASVDDVLNVLQDYNQHSRYYAPDVERARIEMRDGDHFRVFLRFHRKYIISVALNSEHDVRYYRDSPGRAHSRSSSLRIAQVENAGRPGEHEKPPGQDDGLLWKMETWWRMEERDGGVYLQNEAVSLTRDIPAGLGWLVGPFVTSIPKDTLTFTLEATRKAVKEKNAKTTARNAVATIAGAPGPRKEN
jgi:hypothetical protein